MAAAAFTNGLGAGEPRAAATRPTPWAWLAAFGRPRATVSTPRDRLAEAAAVRELAQRYRQSDPGFASDLIAAANRHEVLG